MVVDILIPNICGQFDIGRTIKLNKSNSSMYIATEDGSIRCYYNIASMDFESYREIAKNQGTTFSDFEPVGDNMLVSLTLEGLLTLYDQNGAVIDSYKLQRRKRDERYEQAFSIAVCDCAENIVVSTRTEFGYSRENLYWLRLTKSNKILYTGFKPIYSSVTRSCLYALRFMNTNRKYPMLLGLELDGTNVSILKYCMTKEGIVEVSSGVFGESYSYTCVYKLNIYENYIYFADSKGNMTRSRVEHLFACPSPEHYTYHTTN